MEGAGLVGSAVLENPRALPQLCGVQGSGGQAICHVILKSQPPTAILLFKKKIIYLKDRESTS